MQLKPFLPEKDFEIIKDWLPDERSHALWCANLIAYPLNKANFVKVMGSNAERYGDRPFAAIDNDGTVVGFFCFSVNQDTNEGKLKYVVVDPNRRGKGIGKEMLKLAVRYAFEKTPVDSVFLNVFSDNKKAIKCYQSVGFVFLETDPDVFVYKDESWDRLSMVIRK